jgi:oligoribonuclease NrnB/cAMP/cGMP phosphodiesterase (DHH superfamily)
MTVWCFYHSADFDGKCSGAIVKKMFPDCRMHGINYGEPFPWDEIETGDHVYMVDFGLQPFEDMERLNGMCRLTWIDHHASAIEEAEKRGFNCRGIRRIGDAGCELTWEFIYPNRSMPKAVHLLGRYDVWDWKDTPGALELQYGLRLYGECLPENQRLWNCLLACAIDVDTFTDKVIERGAALVKYEELQNAAYARAAAFEVELDGLRCIAINRGLGGSLMFKSVYDPAKHDAMLAFYRNSHHWMVSLYADKPDVDVGKVCKERGGGGHKGAAGFECKELPF